MKEFTEISISIGDLKEALYLFDNLKGNDSDDIEAYDESILLSIDCEYYLQLYKGDEISMIRLIGFALTFFNYDIEFNKLNKEDQDLFHTIMTDSVNMLRDKFIFE